jgi:hypothetical protein
LWQPQRWTEIRDRQKPCSGLKRVAHQSFLGVCKAQHVAEFMNNGRQQIDSLSVANELAA